MSIRSLNDLRKQEESANDDSTSSFAGGERSALAVQNPTRDFLNAIRSTPPAGATRVSLYRGGFVVDNGEFRPLGEPNNDKFLEELKAGYAPKELVLAGREVHVALEDRRTEDYVPPVKPRELFSGEGQTLSSSNSSTTHTTAVGVVDTARSTVEVDDNKPKTQISIRFYDGQKITKEFNQDQTLADLHDYVSQTAPVNGEYLLLSGYPPKEITGAQTLTLKSAGLLNSNVVQKLA